MKINIIALSMMVAALTVGTASAATVDGGIVHFKGKIIEAACSVSVDSADQIVDLGQYRTAQFTAVGDTTTQIPFNIVLNDCDTSISKKASVAYAGQIDATDGTLLAVNSGGDNSPTATGVGIEILDSMSKTLTPDGQSLSAEKTLIDGTNTIPFSARYKSTAASVTAGLADADATFTMTYQ